MADLIGVVMQKPYNINLNNLKAGDVIEFYFLKKIEESDLKEHFYFEGKVYIDGYGVREEWDYEETDLENDMSEDRINNSDEDWVKITVYTFTYSGGAIYLHSQLYVEYHSSDWGETNDPDDFPGINDVAYGNIYLSLNSPSCDSAQSQNTQTILSTNSSSTSMEAIAVAEAINTSNTLN
ncbi:MAG: hypothetical protein QXW78_00180 [Candidatus Thermoplasmatota archaeon]